MSKINSIKNVTTLNLNSKKILNNKVKDNLVKSKKLERTPGADIIDFSKEEEGILILRNAKGKILRIVDIVFPR